MPYIVLIFILPFFILFESLTSDRYRDSKIALRLISSHTQIKAGDTILCAIETKMKKGWHIYLINPGDAGEPIKFNITINTNLIDTITPLYPVPRRTNTEGVVTFDYFGEVVFPFKLIIPKNFIKDFLEIYVTAEWLVCRERCIPGKTKLYLKLRNIGDSKISERNKNIIEQSFQKLPSNDFLNVQVASDNNFFTMTFTLPFTQKTKSAFIYPISEGIFDLEARQNYSISENKCTIYLKRAQYIGRYNSN